MMRRQQHRGLQLVRLRASSIASCAASISPPSSIDTPPALTLSVQLRAFGFQRLLS